MKLQRLFPLTCAISYLNKLLFMPLFTFHSSLSFYFIPSSQSHWRNQPQRNRSMGRAPCCDKANVKKGPWSPEEDAKLKDYIEQHGTGGNWIALPQKVGMYITWSLILATLSKTNDDGQTMLICKDLATPLCFCFCLSQVWKDVARAVD